MKYCAYKETQVSAQPMCVARVNIQERREPGPPGVLLGKIHVEGIMIGFAPVAGNRIIVGGGLVIPDHGLAVHVMLVPVVPGRPRASITPPPEGRIPPEGLRIVCSTEQMFVPVLPNALASMKSDEFVVVPDEL